MRDGFERRESDIGVPGNPRWLRLAESWHGQRRISWTPAGGKLQSKHASTITMRCPMSRQKASQQCDSSQIKCDRRNSFTTCVRLESRQKVMALQASQATTGRVGDLDFTDLTLAYF